MNRIRLPLVLLGSCLLLSSCSKGPDEPAPASTAGMAVSDSAPRDTAPPQAAGESMQVPEGFPQDVFLYPGAKVVTSMTMPQVQILTLETADPIKQVSTACDEGMQARGWTRTMQMNDGDSSLLTYSKGRQHTQLTIDASGDTTTLSLMVTQGEGEDAQ